MRPVLTIDAVSDFVSPWCFIARRRLARALEQVRGAAEPNLRWAPFELHPAIPKHGMELKAYLRGLFGSTEAARPLLAALTEAGERDGIRFQFDRVKSVPNTRDAHRLILFAERQGREQEIVDGLFTGFFEQGRDIGQRGVLAEVATDAGLDAAGVREYLAGPEGTSEIAVRESGVRALGFEGVPAFVFNDRVAVVGPAETGVLLEAIDKALFRELPQSPLPGQLH
jgi:predicted DsbA family dithiol-disulfide isomerase